MSKTGRSIGTSKKPVFLFFDENAKLEVEIFPGSKCSPSATKVIKMVNFDSTNDQPVKTVTQYSTLDGMPVEPGELEIQLHIDDESFDAVF